MTGREVRALKILAAVIQMTSTTDKTSNIEKAVSLVSEAAARGARIIALPENWTYMRGNDDPPPAGLSIGGPELAAIRNIAKSENVYILAGTIPEAIPGSDKVFNTSVFFAPGGRALALYRKIHLFDVNLSQTEKHLESEYVESGKEVVMADADFGRAGLSVCYDLRFPELYRKMAVAGASVFFVPAAFTTKTGPAHWEALLRARAIENQCFVIAPGQYGCNALDRSTHGNSMIIDAWGNILSRAKDEECVITAELDFDGQARVRRELPSLANAKDWLI